MILSGKTRHDRESIRSLLQQREDYDEQFYSASPQLFQTCKERWNDKNIVQINRFCRAKQKIVKCFSENNW